MSQNNASGTGIVIAHGRSLDVIAFQTILEQKRSRNGKHNALNKCRRCQKLCVDAEQSMVTYLGDWIHSRN